MTRPLSSTLLAVLVVLGISLGWLVLGPDPGPAPLGGGEPAVDGPSDPGPTPAEDVVAAEYDASFVRE